MRTERERWSERAGLWATATHARRIVSFTALLALGCACTVWLLIDPSDALSGTRAVGTVLAPVLVLLALVFLVREFRTGDSRK